MTTKFLTDPQLEDMAVRLLIRYDSLYGAISSPPVPVERILEDVLDLNILWEDISEPPSQFILAALDPVSKTVVFNESRRTVITDTPGLYQTVLAHEAGHWEVHVDQGRLAQRLLPNLGRDYSCLYRKSGPSQDLRGVQAHRFMGFLLMPSKLLMEVIEGVNLLNWPTLYGLRDRFQVTISALTVRLARLGILYVTEDGEPYPSRQEYEGQIRLGG